MRLLQIFLASALILDAALVMTTTATVTSSPAQAVSFSTDSNSISVFSQAAHQ